jgi:membrane protease YdiL (CAAX protease family)
MFSVSKRSVSASFVEALGVFLLFILYTNLFISVFSKRFGVAGILLFWFSYGIFGAIVGYSVRRVNGGWSWRDLGFRVDRGWKQDVWFGTVIYATVYLVSIPLMLIYLPSWEMPQYLSFSRQLSLPLAIFALTGVRIVVGFITGAFHEEIRYRGYLQGLFSRQVAPAFGLFISLIPFSFGHYFAHPDWPFISVLKTVPTGLCFCLGYYASNSLIVPMTTHTLGNLVAFYPMLLYSRGLKKLSYASIFMLAALFVVIIIAGRNDLKLLIKKTKEMFKKSGITMSILGVFFGVILLFLQPMLAFLRAYFEFDQPTYIIVLLSSALCCLWLSFKPATENLRQTDRKR